MKGSLVCLILIASLASIGARAHAGSTDAALHILEELISAAAAAGLPQGVTQSLVSKLRAAAESLKRGNLQAVYGQLGAIENEVRAQRGKALTDDQVEGALTSIRHVKIALDPGPPPVIKNLVVNFDHWDPITNRAGDFIFLAPEDKVFLEFGLVVVGPEGPKTLPTFEYRVAPDTVAVSPIDGTVESIFFQSETSDYEIHLTSSPTSPFLVGVDHVTDLLVAEGDVVTAGQTLGKVGPFSLTLGRTELQVFNFIEETNSCPFELFDPALAPAFKQKVTDLMADWETFKGDASIYDQAAQFAPGCISATVPGD
jgi:hypothetical protein